MAGWSTFANGSSLDCLETVCAYHGLAFDHAVKDHVDLANDDKAKQKCLFYHLFSLYLKESYSRGVVRSVPVLLGDGQPLDLYKLFSLVKERRGYAVVSKKRLWGSVSKELGLSLQVLASVKLAYDKYLNEFEGWLRKNFMNANHGCGWGFKSLPAELEREFRGLFSPNLKWKDEGLVRLESNKIKKYIDVVSHNSETNLLGAKNQNEVCEDVQNVRGDDPKKFCNGGVKDDVATLNPEVAKKELNCHKRKRKREALSGMLNWMRNIAKCPLDPSIQPIPEPSKWTQYKGQDFWVQILRAREALLLKRCVKPNNGLSSLQKLKMHPAMYEDHVAISHPSTVKLRCSERLPASVKSRLCSCCNSCSTNGNRTTNSVNMEAEEGSEEKTTATVDLLTAKIMADQSVNDHIEKHVSVGPLFQAEVPEWTGVSESDSKWLGTQVWPLKNEDSNPDTETDLIGRGRQETCSCQFQGSVECVRFHIAEERMKLKLELGSVFYHWGFDRMGEEVSLQWTTEEEKKFKDIMRSNIPSKNRCFWNSSFKNFFPKKTRKNLVSYYFNAFLIQLRSYQNRVTPKSVDSDDDELEFGSLSDGFGMEAIKGPGTNFLECSHNKQCTDLE